MVNAVEYLNRKFDVLAFNGAKPSGDMQLSQSLFSYATSGTVCTGIQKLAQRWLLEFLTEQGSMPFHMAERGSNFLFWVRRGFIRSEADVRAYFNFAAQQVRSNLLNEESADMRDDERLQSAALMQIQILDGSLALVVNVRSLAGDTRQVVLPINITPSNLQI